MDFGDALIAAGVLTYIGTLIYLANQVDLAHLTGADAAWRDPAVRWLLYGTVSMMFFMGFDRLLASVVPLELAAEGTPQISFLAGIFSLIIASLTGGMSLLFVLNVDLRRSLQGWLGRWGGNFKPDSQVHLVAVILMLALIANSIITVISLGGVSGLAEELEQNGLQPNEVVFQGVVEVIVAFLGVGLAIRRGWPEAAARLGLRIPTPADLRWGIGVGLGCFLASRVVLLLLLLIFSPEWLLEQSAASDQLAASFTTLPLAFLLAVSAGVGEEIWVRGSLQPVFGLLVSTLFFTILHIQVAFTAGTLVILGVSLAFGWLRQRYSTTAAIIAHFMYDFIQLALASLVIGMG